MRIVTRVLPCGCRENFSCFEKERECYYNVIPCEKHPDDYVFSNAVNKLVAEMFLETKDLDPVFNKIMQDSFWEMSD